jgi:hypothetical protein
MKQEQKDFLAIQKEFFGGVLKTYLAPIRLLGGLWNICCEMLRQMLICLFMESGEFQKLQDLKLKEEEDRLIASMGDVEEFEKDNFDK